MKPKLDYVYRAKIVKVIDGDTIDVLLGRGFGDTSKKRLRLADLHAPELHQQDGKRAKQKVEEWVYDRSLIREDNFLIRTIKPNKITGSGGFGRWLAEVWHLEDDGLVSLNQYINNWMLEENIVEGY